MRWTITMLMLSTGLGVNNVRASDIVFTAKLTNQKSVVDAILDVIPVESSSSNPSLPKLVEPKSGYEFLELVWENNDGKEFKTRLPLVKNVDIDSDAGDYQPIKIGESWSEASILATRISSPPDAAKLNIFHEGKKLKEYSEVASLKIFNLSAKRTSDKGLIVKWDVSSQQSGDYFISTMLKIRPDDTWNSSYHFNEPNEKFLKIPYEDLIAPFGKIWIKVSVHQGLSVASAEICVPIAKSAPFVSIDRSTMDNDRSGLNLRATCNDGTCRAGENKFKWVSNLDGQLSILESDYCRYLSPGYHEITLEAVNPSGQTMKLKVKHVQVDPRLDSDELKAMQKGHGFCDG